MPFINIRQGFHGEANLLPNIEEEFEELFKFVLVLDNDGTFLAKLPPAFVKRNLHSLTALFNSKPS